jgi:RNA polymerase sigma-70 factor (ECF subfamily)
MEDVATVEGQRGVLNREPKTLVDEDESTCKDARFESIFLKYYPRVVGILCRLLGDRARAEELASDVFWKLYRQPWLARSDGNVGGWLHRTAINLGIDHLRSLGRQRQHEEEAGRDVSTGVDRRNPLDDVLREEKAHRVRDALAQLRTAYARILILRANGLSYNELADSLGVKRGTVGTMLVRAEAAFEKQFRRMYAHEEAL